MGRGKPLGSISGAALRMRAHRERRRKGLRCFIVELRETEIDALIRGGLLDPNSRNNSDAVLEGLYHFLNRTLDTTRYA